MAYLTAPAIQWYRTPLEPALLRELTRRSDLRGWLQTGSHLGWFLITGAVCLVAFESVSADNAFWSIPALLLALFVHGTMGPFMGLIAVHELQHRTVFRTRWLNVFFEQVYAFISWSDYIWYQESHARHHQSTCHRQYEGEVVLPVRFSLRRWKVWLGLLAWNPWDTLARLRLVWNHANGRIEGRWYEWVLSTPQLRRRHRNWARILLIGHGLLAVVFVAIGYPFLIVVFTFGTFYCRWLGFLCGVAQHYGLNSDVADFRYNTRTFTCGPVVGFYYWNMQYHLEHHMYPAVPFFNLPRLREALEHDLPPASHGLLATWREILELKRRFADEPDFRFLPAVPDGAGASTVTRGVGP